MAFKVTDEALEALNSLGEDERTQVLSGFSQDELRQVTEAMPVWKAKKAPAAPAAPVMSLENPVSVDPPSMQAPGAFKQYGPDSPEVYAAARRAAEGGGMFGEHGAEQGALKGVSYGDAILAGVNTIKKPIVAGARKWLDGAFAMAGLDAQEPINGQITLANMPENLLLHDAAGGAIAGDSYSETIPEPYLSQAEAATPPLARTAAYIAGAAAPILPPVTKAARAGSTVVKAAEGASKLQKASAALQTAHNVGKEGAVSNLILAMANPDIKTWGDYGATVGGGYVAGGTLGVAAAKVGDALGKVKAAKVKAQPVEVAHISKDMAPAFHAAMETDADNAVKANRTAVIKRIDETAKKLEDTLIINRNKPKPGMEQGTGGQFHPEIEGSEEVTPELLKRLRAQGAAEHAAAAPELKGVEVIAAIDDGFTPSHVVFTTNNSGAEVARILEVRVGAEPRVAEVPLDSEAAVKQLRGYMDSKQLSATYAPAWASWPAFKRNAIEGLDRLRVSNAHVSTYNEWGALRGQEDVISLPAGHEVKAFEEGGILKFRIVPVDGSTPAPKTGEVVAEAAPAGNGTVGGRRRNVKPPDDVIARNIQKVESWKETSEIPVGYIKDADGSVAVWKVGETPDGRIAILRNRNNPRPEYVAQGEFHPVLDTVESERIVPESRRVASDISATDALSPSKLRDEVPIIKKFDEAVSRNPTLREKVLGSSGKFVAPQHTLPADLATIVREAQAANDIKAVRDLYMKALTKRLGGVDKLRGELDKDLGAVFSGRISIEDAKAKHPAFTQELETFVQGVKEYSQKLQDELRAVGALSDDAYFRQNEFEQYLVRSYYSYLFPKGKWAQVAPQDAIENATKHIVKDMERAGVPVTPIAVNIQLREIMNAEDPLAAFYSSRLGQTRAYDSLRKRQAMPGWMTTLMGEVDSGSMRIALTLSNQETLLAQYKLYNEIAADPKYYSHGPQPHLHSVPVPNDKLKFGPLAGGYVSPELYEHVISVPNIPQAVNGLLGNIHALRKGNLITSVSAHTRQILDGIRSSVLAGGVDIIGSPVKAGTHMVNAVKALRDFSSDPTGRTGLGKVIKEMKVFGADWAGTGEVEIGKNKNWVKEVYRQLAAEKGTDPFSFLDKLSNLTLDKYKAGLSGNGHILDLQDKVWRTANYIGLKERFLANPSKYLPGVAPENVSKEAARLAARRIQDSFMNAAHVGSKVESMSRGVVGTVFAPYLRATTEEARALALIPMRMREDPELKWRLGKYAAFGAGLYAAAKWGNPNSVAAQESAKAQMTDMTASQRQALLPLPIKDKQGNVRFLDLTPYFMPATIMRGHPDDHIASRMAINALLLPVEGGSGESGIRKFIEHAGLQKPTQPYGIKEDEQGIATLLNGLAQSGGVPAIANTLRNATNKVQNNGRFNPTWTPGDVAAKALATGYTGPMRPDNPAGLVESARQIQGYGRQIKSNYGNPRLSQEEKDSRRDKNVSFIQREADTISRRKEALDAFTAEKKGKK